MEKPTLQFTTSEIGERITIKHLDQVLQRVKRYYPQVPAEIKARHGSDINIFLSINRQERRLIEKAIFKKLITNPHDRNKLEKAKIFPDLLAYSFRRSDSVAEAVLNVWIASYPDLHASVLEFLTKRNVPVGRDTDSFVKGFWGDITAELDKLIEEFGDDHKEFNRNDVLLMFSCMTGCLPEKAVDKADQEEAAELEEEKEAVEVEEEETIDGEPEITEVTLTEDGEKDFEPELAGMMWEDWLKRADALLAPEAREWDAVETFVERLQALAASKVLERSSGKVKLAESLARLSADFADYLNAWGKDTQAYGSWGLWDADLCPPKEAGALAVSIEELHTAFGQYDELREQMSKRETPPSIRQGMRARFGLLEEEISSLYANVAKLLYRPEPQPDSQGAQDGQGGQVEEASKKEEMGAGQKTVTMPEPLLAFTPEPEPPPAPPEEPKRDPELEPPPVPEASISIYAFTPEINSQKIAALILAAPPDERFEHLRDLLWRLVHEGRLDFALSISKFVEQNYIDQPLWLRPWLLTAVALGPEVLTRQGRLEMLLQDAFKEFDPDDLFVKEQKEWNQATRLLLVAAALRPSLLAPETGAPQVLQQLEFTGLSRLYDYCRVISEAMERYPLFDADTLKRVKEFVSWNAELNALTSEAVNWREKASEFSFQFQPASLVWQHWLRAGFVSELINPVCENNLAGMAGVENIIEKYSADKVVKDEVTRTDRNVLNHPVSRGNIDSRNVGYIVDHTHEVLELARRWVALQKIRPRAIGRREEEAEKFGVELLRRRQEILEEFEAFEGSISSFPVRTGGDLCRRALFDLWRLFDPQIPLPAEELDPRHILYANMLRVPGLALGDDWAPLTPESEETLTAVLKSLADPSTGWGKAFEASLESGNHLTAQRILTHLKSSPDADPSLEVIELAQMQAKNLREWRDTLRQRADDTRRVVERAWVNDWLTDEESDNHLKAIRAIRGSVEETLYFPEKLEQLQAIQEDIGEKLKHEKARVRERLAGHGIAEDHPGYERIIRTLENGDIRTANEYIDVLEDNSELPEGEKERDYLRDFFPQVVREFGKFEGASPEPLIQKVGSRQSVAGVDLRSLTQEQAEESAGMLKAWFKLRGAVAVAQEDVKRILNHLGFSIQSVSAGGQLRQRRWLEAAGEPVRDKDVCAVAAYGSQARGRYRILCVMDQPMEEELFNAVGETARKPPVIVFYFGLMSEHERREIAGRAREHAREQEPRSFIVVDDALILFLCGQHKHRLRALFECTLPFTYIEPYVPVGLVPLETFYGRRADQQAITAPNGPCFIYGGKRLGKTALLNKIASEFHQPEEGKVALYIDLKEEGISSNADDLWRLLARKLQDKETDKSKLRDLKIFPATMSTNIGWAAMLGHIKAWLGQDESRRILFLLDEADAFLEADGEVGTGEEAEFIRVHRLMKLWERTNGRFKAVFAGLHNVQRTTKLMPNLSLWHFGETDDATRCIGPLLGRERVEAIELIKRPLYALGYRFQSPDLVIRILSHTNWYPSLIQLYCHHLLRYINGTRSSIFEPKSSPPYMIRSEHVEDAYRKVLHGRIKERFHLTLQLDPRYKVIAYAIAHRLLSDEKRGGLTVEEIQREALDWWEQGFRETDSVAEHSFRALLDEMEGLGIVRREGEGMYTLRSVNVFAILGKKKEIEQVLRGPHETPLKYQTDSFRSAFRDPLTHATVHARRNPLTWRQLAELRANKNGASIIYGTGAAGLSDLRDFLAMTMGEKFFVEMGEAPDALSFGEQLREALPKREANGTALFFVSHARAWDYEWVEEALKRVATLTSQASWVRVVFVADPRKTWQLVGDNSARLVPITTEGLISTSLTPWDDVSLRQWLEDCNHPSTPEDRKLTLEVSGNWPLCLQRLHELEADSPNWQTCLGRFKARLDDAAYARNLFGAFGLDTEESRGVLLGMAEWQGPINIEELSELVVKPVEEVGSIIRWAKQLALVTPGEKGTWIIDPVVSQISIRGRSAKVNGE